MKLTSQMKKTVEHQFDSYCKKILLSELKNYKKECYKLREREVLVDEFVYETFIANEYSSFELSLSIGAESFLFKNEFLYEAMQLLDEDKRMIILYFYFLNMSDREISNSLKLIRRTVNYKRNKALKELKKRLEMCYEI